MSSSVRSTKSSRNTAIFTYDSTQSQTTDHRTRHETNDEDMDRLVSDCVKYMLIMDNKKTAIKRSDIVKAIVRKGQTEPKGQAFKGLIDKVRLRLDQVFGIQLVDCPDKTNEYILVNKMNNKEIECRSDVQMYRTSVLSLVLSVIFMNGQSCAEHIMWNFLAKLGFDVNSKSQLLSINDEPSNNVTIKKMMTEQWVRQLYLKYDRMDGSDPITHEFRWGVRAEHEFKEIDILQFVCNIYNDSSKPEDWRSQYDKCQQHNDLDNEIHIITD
ncbi:non-structural maintenance of chromosomes element 3 homolog [Oppia nitens]|uniref:non-structural maintenance of chromosomes element 3 homolog n=1 Tax=Oppia nitens TaxID=1686743 RepID=UPI0023DB5FFA|nr:non-structural maintenance of chromosomes element 3 homolog [Oppia nitens]